jgi:hypothetical protein
MNFSVWPDSLRKAVEAGEFDPFAVAVPVTPDIFENQVSAYLDLRKASERNSDFLPRKFMSKFPNILKSIPTSTSPAAVGADQTSAGDRKAVLVLKENKSSSSEPRPKSRSAPADEGADLGLTYEFTLATGTSHVLGEECPEEKKLMVFKWMLKQQSGVVRLAAGSWKVRPGKFQPPEWVVKAAGGAES